MQSRLKTRPTATFQSAPSSNFNNLQCFEGPPKYLKVRSGRAQTGVETPDEFCVSYCREFSMRQDRGKTYLPLFGRMFSRRHHALAPQTISRPFNSSQMRACLTQHKTHRSADDFRRALEYRLQDIAKKKEVDLSRSLSEIDSGTEVSR
jgi:hypothetical protein